VAGSSCEPNFLPLILSPLAKSPVNRHRSASPDPFIPDEEKHDSSSEGESESDDEESEEEAPHPQTQVAQDSRGVYLTEEEARDFLEIARQRCVDVS
jgi:hypothetical protein